MAQKIENLPVDTIINIPEISGTAQYKIKQTVNTNPYGNKRILVRRVYLKANTESKFNSSGSSIYANSTLDEKFQTTYPSYFPQNVLNCILSTSIITLNINTGQNYYLSRKIFCPTLEEIGDDWATTLENTISKKTSFLRDPYNSTEAVSINLNGNKLHSSVTTSTYSQIAFNLSSDTLVSSNQNSDGSYNLLPSAYAYAKLTNAGINNARVNLNTFKSKLSDYAEYSFSYNGTDWTCDTDDISGFTPITDISTAQLKSIYGIDIYTASAAYTGSGITGMTFINDNFINAVSAAGTYTFTYNGTAWDCAALSLTNVTDYDLSNTYGISLEGTVANGDTVTVTTTPSLAGGDILYVNNVNPNKIVDFECNIGESLRRPNKIKVDFATEGVSSLSGVSIQVCNNYGSDNEAWENSTYQREHIFSNTSKTTTNWVIGIKVHVESENSMKIYEPTALITTD